MPRSTCSARIKVPGCLRSAGREIARSGKYLWPLTPYGIAYHNAEDQSAVVTASAYRLRRWLDRGNGALARAVSGFAGNTQLEIFAVLRSSGRSRTWLR